MSGRHIGHQTQISSFAGQSLIYLALGNVRLKDKDIGTVEVVLGVRKFLHLVAGRAAAGDWYNTSDGHDQKRMRVRRVCWDALLV